MEHRDIRRNEDPRNAHDAARRIAPTRGSRREKVLQYLRDQRGEWIPGYELTTPEVGGSEGLRRLRELRVKNGYPIESRPSGDGTTWEYRLPRRRIIRKL